MLGYQFFSFISPSNGDRVRFRLCQPGSQVFLESFNQLTSLIIYPSMAPHTHTSAFLYLLNDSAEILTFFSPLVLLVVRHLYKLIWREHRIPCEETHSSLLKCIVSECNTAQHPISQDPNQPALIATLLYLQLHIGKRCNRDVFNFEL